MDLTPFDLPGPTRRKVTCVKCGQVVRDNREVVKDGLVLLPALRRRGPILPRPREIAWPEMNWSPMYAGAGTKAGSTDPDRSPAAAWPGEFRGSEMIKTIKLEEAVGTQAGPRYYRNPAGRIQGSAFRKGHTVCEEDLCRLQRLGKNHLYVIDLEEDEIHENEAAAILAEALAGEGVAWENNPREGKINLYAARDGLLQVDVPGSGRL